MVVIIELRAERLVMRQWCKQDWPAFAQLNADPQVMAYYPNVLGTEESNAMAQKMAPLIALRGWGFWAVASNNEQSFMGFVGLHEPAYDLPVTPCVEIGWRLAKHYWGQGYATEAAVASLEAALKKLNLSAEYSFASVSNVKSLAVMERISMSNTHENFQHPIIPKNNPLREHALYKITRQQWMEH